MEGRWTCGQCTFSNHEDLPNCEICDHPRGVQIAEPEAQMQQEMADPPQEEEAATTYLCGWCNRERPPDGKKLSDEWFCSESCQNPLMQLVHYRETLGFKTGNETHDWGFGRVQDVDTGMTQENAQRYHIAPLNNESHGAPPVKRQRFNITDCECDDTCEACAQTVCVDLETYLESYKPAFPTATITSRRECNGRSVEEGTELIANWEETKEHHRNLDRCWDDDQVSKRLLLRLPEL